MSDTLTITSLACCTHTVTSNVLDSYASITVENTRKCKRGKTAH